MLLSASRLVMSGGGRGCGRGCGTIVRVLSRYDGRFPVNNNAVSFAVRNRSDGDGGDDGEDDDPFGINYNDGKERLGPEAELPPRYVRDSVSGKLTGETRKDDDYDYDYEDGGDDEDDETALRERVTEYWTADDTDEKEDAAARSVRRRKTALHTVGRSVGRRSDGDDKENAAFAPLSRNEFESFRSFAARERDDFNVEEDDLPVVDDDRSFDPKRDLSWVPGSGDGSDPFDLGSVLPSDLTPPRKLNRREAAPLPKELLHHNNVDLLRRYVTPGGQISNRMRTRLGAKDQRKIAKLIKRARHLGLIPHVGQWKYEDHGDILADDIDKDRDWEIELKTRGLFLERRKNEGE